MSHLKELILYLSIENRVVFVDGTRLYNEILIHMPQLRVRFGSFETRILHWNYTIFPIAEEINGFEFCISVLHFWDSKTKQFQYNQLHSIVEFPHLASLNVRRADVYYVEQFLNTEKTHLPRLTELEVDYDNLVTVTDNFTRDATRGNCAKVKWLIFEITIEYSRAVHAYFPSL
ncbi:unnamed protein product [Rotaria socialis]|uniref:Uncharacterized protein n=1 Tax=Rotaria socialis TaxID=392032 RepID=A0A821YK03_9BILA|nr:unnamed protein product [Rotaria socialis]